jgi:hypothetical protein
MINGLKPEHLTLLRNLLLTLAEIGATLFHHHGTL